MLIALTINVCTFMRVHLSCCPCRLGK